MNPSNLDDLIRQAKAEEWDILLLGKREIASLPDSIYELSNLVRLDLTGNRIKSLSAKLVNLTKLEELFLDENNLDALPREISLLKNLKILSVSKNNLKKLPREIGELKNLIELDISKNQIPEFPIQIKKLKKLKKLNISGNLGIPIPSEISEKVTDPNVLLEFYLSPQEDSRRPLLEAKLVLVGEASVGKTSIRKRLIDGVFDPGEDTTRGITIQRWPIKDLSRSSDSANPKIQLNVWDFGGQVILHAAHQFFLTKRSLYLLVVNARNTQEQNKIEYWLKLIESFGGDSPVLIIGNKIDQALRKELDIDRIGLQNKYSNIVGIIETSAATGEGIQKLSEGIAEHVSALPFVRDLLPESWFKIKTHLEALGKERNYINRDEYIELCELHGVTEKIKQQTLIGFLHDLGVVVYFQDDPRLEVLGILNPQWVTYGVYEILNSNVIFQNTGILTLSMLDQVLDSPDYPKDKQLFIIELMRKFELCYQIDKDSFLIPGLLSENEGFHGEWNNSLEFHYHYKVLPPSVITRFIVRMNPYILNKTVWRTGVVLAKGQNKALIKADMEERKIIINVIGDSSSRRGFLDMIRSEFNIIHNSFAKLDFDELVTIPNHPDSDPIKYSHLLQFERDGRKTIPIIVGEKSEDISVRALLNGVSLEPITNNDLVQANNQSIMVESNNKFVKYLKLIFVAFPKTIGHLILVDILNRPNAAIASILITGYAVIVILIILVVVGFTNFDILKQLWALLSS